MQRLLFIFFFNFWFLQTSAQQCFTSEQVFKIANTIDSLETEVFKLKDLDSLNIKIIRQMTFRDSVQNVQTLLLKEKIDLQEREIALVNSSLKKSLDLLRKKQSWYYDFKIVFPLGIASGIFITKFLIQ